MISSNRNNQKEEELVEKASRLGQKYLRRYHGCAEATLASIADTLGMEIDDVFKAMIGISGGVGDMCYGACGAMAGAAIAISLRFGYERDKYEREIRYKIFDIIERIGKRFIEEYGSYLCCDIQEKILGKSFYLLDPKEHDEYKKAKGSEECAKVVGKACGWAVKEILEADEK
jgi:C_GCAxxG_C_C family probable redox protein